MPHRLLALAVTAVLALSACSGDPQPKIAPSESASPTVTSSASPSPSGPADPVEVVRAWVEAQNVALDTGSIDSARALSADSCTSCEELLKPVRDVYEAGGHFKTRGWMIDRIKPDRVDDSRASVNVALTIAGGTTVPAEGESAVKYPIDKRIAVFRLQKRASQWLVSFVGFL